MGMLGSRHIVDLGDYSISCIELSSDSTEPPLLFLHGWGGSAESFQPLMAELNKTLSPGRRMIALDLPGFGKSPLPPKAWFVSDYLSCVVKYLRSAHIKAVDLIAHSFGGRITTKLLQTNPELVRRIVYIAPAGIRGDLTKLTARKQRAHKLKRLFENPLLKPLFPLVRRLGYRAIGGQDYLATSGVMKETFTNVVEEDLADLLPQITQPTRIFWGRNDTYVPVSDGQHMAQVLANAELTIFEDGRHGIHKTHAAAIAAQLKNFL